MSDGIVGLGTTLAGATTGTVGNITDLSHTGARTDEIDKSTCDSSNGFKEYLFGLMDPGTLTLTVNYDGSAAGVANSLYTNWEAKTSEVWTITFSDTSTFACSGTIIELGEALTFDGKVTQNITIKLTGDPTFTDVS